MNKIKISAFDCLVEEFACKLGEFEYGFESLTLAAKEIKFYISMSLIDQIDALNDPHHEGYDIVNIYGVGEYEAAKIDLLEYQVMFN